MSAGAEQFVERFAKAWDRPSAAALNALLTDDVELVQPLERPTHGIPATLPVWARLFALMPDVRGDVLSWGAEGDDVFIELRLAGTVAGTRIEWVTLDRIRLRDGKVAHRTAHFDALALIRQIATHPRALARFVRVRLTVR